MNTKLPFVVYLPLVVRVCKAWNGDRKLREKKTTPKQPTTQPNQTTTTRTKTTHALCSVWLWLWDKVCQQWWEGGVVVGAWPQEAQTKQPRRSVNLHAPDKRGFLSHMHASRRSLAEKNTLCVCSMCTFLCVHVCSYVLVCGRQRSAPGVFPSCPPLFQDWSLELTDPPSPATSDLHGASISPDLGLQMNTPVLSFKWFPGIQTQVLTLVGQTLYRPSHLPNPRMIF